MNTALEKCFIALIISAALGVYANAEQIKPFISDGCSVFPDGHLKENKLWLHCCKAHDYAYWQGGTSTQRKAADKALQQCVAQENQPSIAMLMLVGVRIGGSPLFPSPFRWGYGWSYPRGYKALTKQEQLNIKKAAKHAF